MRAPSFALLLACGGTEPAPTTPTATPSAEAPTPAPSPATEAPDGEPVPGSRFGRTFVSDDDCPSYAVNAYQPVASEDPDAAEDNPPDPSAAVDTRDAEPDAEVELKLVLRVATVLAAM